SSLAAKKSENSSCSGNCIMVPSSILLIKNRSQHPISPAVYDRIEYVISKRQGDKTKRARIHSINE
ncbi:hypothetical protein Q0O77_15300, partial [Staphylococcus aureus]|nr:hypothetical protein [Staphylococcus aureus]